MFKVTDIFFSNINMFVSKKGIKVSLIIRFEGLQQGEACNIGMQIHSTELGSIEMRWNGPDTFVR